MAMVDRDSLQWLAEFANALAFDEFEFRNSCIHTSAAIHDVLVAEQIPAELLRVKATVFGKIRPCVLGSDGDGMRRPPSSGWHGHLVVIAGNRFLVDATLDQANDAEHPFALRPLVREVTPAFLRGEENMHFTDCGESGDITVYYHAFPGRNGWKSKPAFRLSQRRWIVETLLTVIRTPDQP
jgi:hypothetical protein